MHFQAIMLPQRVCHTQATYKPMFFLLLGLHRGPQSKRGSVEDPSPPHFLFCFHLVFQTRKFGVESVEANQLVEVATLVVGDGLLDRSILTAVQFLLMAGCILVWVETGVSSLSLHTRSARQPGKTAQLGSTFGRGKNQAVLHPV